MAASPYDGLYWDTHIPLGVHKMLQDLAGKNPLDPNLPDAWSPSEREWFSLPRSADNYSLKHNVYTFGSIGNFFSADGGRTVLGDNGFTADQGNDVDYTQGGAAAKVGRSLNPAVFHWVPVAYNTTAYPITDALQSAVDKTVNMILGSVGGVFLIGNGLGAVVASGIYNEFRTGRLMSRRSDLLGVYNFGNPLRQGGHTIPGGTDPGGHGMAPASKRLTNTENLVWEFANPLDPVATVGASDSEIKQSPSSGLVVATAKARLLGGKVKIDASLDVTAIPSGKKSITATAKASTERIHTSLEVTAIPPGKNFLTATAKSSTDESN